MDVSVWADKRTATETCGFCLGAGDSWRKRPKRTKRAIRLSTVNAKAMYVKISLRVVIVYSVRKPGIVVEIAALSSWTRGEQASEVL